MNYFYRTEMSNWEPSGEVSAPTLNLDVRRRGLDPFFRGVAVGAVATLIGVLLGLFFLLPI